MPDDFIYQSLGENKADILSIKNDLKELKENQKLILSFISEQRAGKKFVWIIFGAAAGLLTFVKDFNSLITNFFHR